MADTKHPAEDTAPAQLADHLASDYAWLREEYGVHIASMIGAERAVRRIPALEAERDDYLEQRDAAQEELRRCQQDAINLQAEHDMEMAGAKDVIGRQDQFLAMADAERDALRAEVERERAARKQAQIEREHAIQERNRAGIVARSEVAEQLGKLRADAELHIDLLKALDTIFAPVARDSTAKVWIDAARIAIAAARGAT